MQNQSNVTEDPESAGNKLAINNSQAKNLTTKSRTRALLMSANINENRPKMFTPKPRPNTVPTVIEPNISKCNEDNKSLCSSCTQSFQTDFGTRTHKLGLIPSYLKKETKASVQSELVNKCKRFKADIKELLSRQTSIKKNYENLKTLKERLKALGGRDFKLETLELITFTGDESVNGSGDGFKVGTETFKDPLLVFDIEQKIKNIRKVDDEFRHKVIEANAEILKQLQEFGNNELQKRSHEIFTKIGEDWKCLTNVKEMGVELILQDLHQLKSSLLQETSDIHCLTPHCGNDDNEIKRQIEDLQTQSKILQCEAEEKDRQIEYLTNECNSNLKVKVNEEMIALRSEIQNKESTINDYKIKFDECIKQQKNYEVKIRKLEERIGKFNDEIKENIRKHEKHLSEKQNKCLELERKLEELRKNKINKDEAHHGSRHEILSSQLATANEDIKELQFKINKREKQIQTMKQMLTVEKNRWKEYDDLHHKYEEIRHQESCKAQEVNQLKEIVSKKTNTINGQMETILELKNMLYSQGATNTDGSKDDLQVIQDDNILKLTKQEKIIEKLENNKIRSNVLRDQLLDRISILEKENEEMKTQIRKFHEDFTINRYMYDEQRRKKRLTEILVKQIQK